MKILIQTHKNAAIRIDIGYETPFHSCTYWLSITREYYDERGELCHGKWVLGLFKNWKLRKSKIKKW